MVSIIVVNFNGDCWIDLLLRSIKKTVSKDFLYEIIVVDNSNNSNLDYSCYGFDNIKYLPTHTTQRNFIDQSFNNNGHNVSSGSFHHSFGLTLGFNNIDSKSDRVLFLDHDTFFLKSEWDSILNLLSFESPLLGTRLENAYSLSFLRPMFLAIHKDFFFDFITNQNGIYPHREYGDTACQLTHKVKTENKNIILLKNSVNNKEMVSEFSFGETAFDLNDIPFHHHFGRGFVDKEKRLPIIMDELQSKGLI